jgi:uncharacterized protein (DUF305 family)
MRPSIAHSKSPVLLVAALAVSLFAGAALAEHHEPALPGDTNSHSHDQGQQSGAKPAGEDLSGGKPQLSEASKAFDEAMRKMHKDMALPYTGDVDVDFVRGMIPHHQGAIEQAEVLLKYSKNPRLRRLAGGIIAAQKREIRFMEKWLKEHAQGVETSDMPDWLKNTPAPNAEPKREGDTSKE